MKVEQETVEVERVVKENETRYVISLTEEEAKVIRACVGSVCYDNRRSGKITSKLFFLLNGMLSYKSADNYFRGNLEALDYVD